MTSLLTKWSNTLRAHYISQECIRIPSDLNPKNRPKRHREGIERPNMGPFRCARRCVELTCVLPLLLSATVLLESADCSSVFHRTPNPGRASLSSNAISLDEDDDIFESVTEPEDRQMRIGLLNSGFGRNMSLNLSSLVVLGLGVAAAVSLFSFFDSSGTSLFQRSASRRRRHVERLLDIQKVPYGKSPSDDDRSAADDGMPKRLLDDDDEHGDVRECAADVIDDSLRLVCDLMGLLCPDAANKDTGGTALSSSSKNRTASDDDDP